MGTRETLNILPKPTSLTDIEMIQRALGGDADAFRSLYDRHKSKVYYFCLRFARDPAVAEDLTQEAFLAVFRKMHTFRGESKFSTWLYRVTANLIFMRRRKVESRMEFVSLSDGLDEDSTAPELDISMDHRLDAMPDQVRLERALGELSPGYAMVFLLHDVYGYEHNEIAEMLDCSEGNSKSQLHKAHLRLREMLAMNLYNRASSHRSRCRARDRERLNARR